MSEPGTDSGSLPPGGTFRLRPGVQRVRRRAGYVWLVSAEGTPLRASATVDDLWPLLTEGVRFDDLAARLRARYPRAHDIEPKLTAFLHRLRAAHLLEGDETTTGLRPKVLFKFDPDPLARTIALPVQCLPRAVTLTLLGVTVGAAVLGIGLVLVSPSGPRFIHLMTRFSALGLALATLIMVPLHELGHLLACRLMGQPAAEAGVRLDRYRLPRPYVVTPTVLLTDDRWVRFWVPCGGPLADLLVGGAVAWVILATGSTPSVTPALRFLLMATVVNVIVGTCPIPSGDGSHTLEALLGDEFARRSALSGRRSHFTSPHTVLYYRLACLAHLGLTLTMSSLLAR